MENNIYTIWDEAECEDPETLTRKEFIESAIYNMHLALSFGDFESLEECAHYIIEQHGNYSFNGFTYAMEKLDLDIQNLLIEKVNKFDKDLLGSCVIFMN